jgi:hypothetical protein
MRENMEAHWNQFNTLVQRQWARLVDALEILAGRRPRALAEPTRSDKAPGTAKPPNEPLAPASKAADG